MDKEDDTMSTALCVCTFPSQVKNEENSSSLLLGTESRQDASTGV